MTCQQNKKYQEVTGVAKETKEQLHCETLNVHESGFCESNIS